VKLLQCTSYKFSRYLWCSSLCCCSCCSSCCGFHVVVSRCSCCWRDCWYCSCGLDL